MCFVFRKICCMEQRSLNIQLNNFSCVFLKRKKLCFSKDTRVGKRRHNSHFCVKYYSNNNSTNIYISFVKSRAKSTKYLCTAFFC